MKKAPFKIEDVYVLWNNLPQGLRMYTAWINTFQAPIGLVWGVSVTRQGVTSFDVFHSFVHPWARRKGVRTKINEYILGHTDTILTSDGTKEGGMAFLKASGYKTHKPTGILFLTKRKRKCPKRK